MIEIKNISKQYGEREILTDLSFVAKKGEITGLIGPNGSGKSTLIRILLGLEVADTGTAFIKGKRYAELGDNPFGLVGSFLDECQPYPTRTAYGHLRWVGLACGVSKERCLECLDLISLSTVGRKKIKDFSLGMKQRLGLATAILGDPDVLILDEPINGLDPEGIRWVRDFLREFVSQGKTVLMTSHYMGELEMTVDRVVGISKGEIVLNDTRDRVLDKYGTFENAYFKSLKQEEV